MSCWINICGCSKVSCAVIGKACEAEGDKIRHNLGPWEGNLKGEKLPSRKLTYPTWGIGKSSSNMPYQGDMLISWRVSEIAIYSLAFWHLCRNTVFCMESRYKYSSVKSSVHLVDSPQIISKSFHFVKRSIKASDQIL